MGEVRDMSVTKILVGIVKIVIRVEGGDMSSTKVLSAEYWILRIVS